MEMTLSQLYQYLEDAKVVANHNNGEVWQKAIEGEIKETQKRINKIIIDSFY